MKEVIFSDKVVIILGVVMVVLFAITAGTENNVLKNHNSKKMCLVKNAGRVFQL